MYDFHNFALTPMQDLIVNIAILSLLVLAILRAERRMENSSPFAILAILTIFCVAGRILLEPIPNVQPVTVTIILVGVFYGAPWAIAISGIIALSTNMIFLGHGPWTLFQVIGWATVGVAGSIFAEKLIIDGRIAVGRLMILAAVSAFAFDWIVSTSILLNHDFSTLMTYLANGIVFDMYHAAGNIAFVAWLANPFSHLMLRHKIASSGRTVSEVVTN